MSNDDLIYSLARQCARGNRQLSFVNELLSWNTVRGDYCRPEGSPQDTWTVLFGQSKLTNASWVNLKRRLIAAGFIVADRRGHDAGVAYVVIHIDHPARWKR